MEDSNRNDNPDETDESGNKPHRLGTAADCDEREGILASAVEEPDEAAADGAESVSGDDASMRLEELYRDEMARDRERGDFFSASASADEAQESFFEGATEQAAEAAPKKLYRLGKVKPVAKGEAAATIPAAIVTDREAEPAFAEASAEPAAEEAEALVAAPGIGAGQGADPAGESEPKPVIEPEIAIEDAEKRRREKKPKRNRSGGVRLSTIVTILIVAILVIALIVILIIYFARCGEEPEEEIPGERDSIDFSITDSDGNPWSDDLSTKLFFNEPRGALNIAPGDTGEYIFTVENREDVEIYLDIDLSETFESSAGAEIPMGYRISQDGVYVFGSEGYEKVDGDNPEATNLAIAAGSSSEFSIEWRWDDGDDELDTSIGEAGGTYSLGISLSLSAD